MRYACLAAAAVALYGSAALAATPEQFPVRPVRIVVPSSPGGGLDVLGRILSPRLTAKWRQQIVIDNRAGAGGIIGTDIVAKAPPDGHNLLVVTTGFVTNPFVLRGKLPYETPGDFEPITIIGITANVLAVHPSVAAKNVTELIALAGKGRLAYASAGVGSGGHLAFVSLLRAARAEMTHVPYKGAGASTAAVVSGEVQALITATSAAQPQIKAGRIRPLAVTSAKRTAVLPDVPTVAESGIPDYAVEGWYGMLGPGKMPKDLLQRIYRDVVDVMRMPEVTAQIEGAGFSVSGITPAEFKQYIAKELKTWEAVIKAAGIKSEE